MLLLLFTDAKCLCLVEEGEDVKIGNDLQKVSREV